MKEEAAVLPVPGDDGAAAGDGAGEGGARTYPRVTAAGLLVLAAVPAGLVMGFFSGESLLAAIVAACAIMLFVFVAGIRLSAPVKIILLLICLTFLQRVFGYFKMGDMRGLNLGNLLLIAALGYWILHGLGRGKLYSPTPIDFWLILALIAFPLFSMFHTMAFRRVPFYDIDEELSRFKQWVTPFIYFFLVCQCFEKKKDIRILVLIVITLIGLAVLQGLPEALRLGNWRQNRSEGIIAQPNEYAAILTAMAPFLFLTLFLLQKRPVLRIASLVLLALFAFSILTTYSRAGYFGFGLGLIGAVYLSYRVSGKLPINLPVLVVMGASLLPLVAVPSLLDSVKDRFQMESYKTAKRQSYDSYRLLNQFSGDRLVLWRGALIMAQENPLFGVGFHVFPTEVAKYHPKGFKGVNYPHNVFLGALAEGGIIWLSILLAFFWKLFQLLYQNWEAIRRRADPVGQVICGGGLLAFFIMIWTSLSNDFFNPGPKGAIFWVTMAATIRYGILARLEEKKEEGSDSPPDPATSSPG